MFSNVKVAGHCRHNQGLLSESDDSTSFVFSSPWWKSPVTFAENVSRVPRLQKKNTQRRTNVDLPHSWTSFQVDFRLNRRRDAFQKAKPPRALHFSIVCMPWTWREMFSVLNLGTHVHFADSLSVKNLRRISLWTELFYTQSNVRLIEPYNGTNIPWHFISFSASMGLEWSYRRYVCPCYVNNITFLNIIVLIECVTK